MYELIIRLKSGEKEEVEKIKGVSDYAPILVVGENTIYIRGFGVLIETEEKLYCFQLTSYESTDQHDIDTILSNYSVIIDYERYGKVISVLYGVKGEYNSGNITCYVSKGVKDIGYMVLYMEEELHDVNSDIAQKILKDLSTLKRLKVVPVDPYYEYKISVKT